VRVPPGGSIETHLELQARTVSRQRRLTVA
jgi:hypothetical protein